MWTQILIILVVYARLQLPTGVTRFLIYAAVSVRFQINPDSMYIQGSAYNIIAVIGLLPVCGYKLAFFHTLG